MDKLPFVVWRGSLAVGSGHDAREGLVRHSEGQWWSDVQTLNWANKTEIKERLLSMEDHCGYMFAAQTEGNTYSGRLKFLLNCNSVVLAHDMKFIEHFHHLLQPSGPDQNYVKLKRDFSDLQTTMRTFRTGSGIIDAMTIAGNARSTFRERYLTPAATACYWRSLIRGWSTVQGFTPELWVDRPGPPDPAIMHAARPTLTPEETEQLRAEHAKFLEKEGITLEQFERMQEDGEKVREAWERMRKSKRKMRGAPFEAYVVMEAVEWDVPAKPRRVCVEED
jgi:hypothetical protein